MKLILTPADLSFEVLEKEYLRRKELKSKELNDRRGHAIEVAKKVLANRYLWWMVKNFEETTLLGYAYGTLRHVEELFPSSDDGYANVVVPLEGGREPANFIDEDQTKGKTNSQIVYCPMVERIVQVLCEAENESDLPKDLAEEIHDIRMN